MMHRGTFFDDCLLIRALVQLLPPHASPEHILRIVAAKDPQHWHRTYVHAIRRMLMSWQRRGRARWQPPGWPEAYRRAITPEVPHCRRCQRWVDACQCGEEHGREGG